ncbi:MAG: PfkB family carbohydrate kinase [Armatimonadota bacterium]|nr:PfkB family carbohydrate kinase [Armatimonadota bacterium]
MSAERFSGMIGVGGIGAGVFFAIRGNATLGREESRGGHFLDRRDYCKLHIIAHYVKVLSRPRFEVIPIGKVGDDEVGQRLLREMSEIGLDLRYVEISPGDSTLFSFCFVYPDGSGGNLTTDDSACSKVDADFVRRAEPEFQRFGSRGIALAVPEVPIEARVALLDLATHYKSFRAASFTSEEVTPALDSNLLQKVDLLALNRDEASVLADLPEGSPTENIVRAAVERAASINPGMVVVVTAGREGSWSWSGTELQHVPAMDVEPVGTAGAGDAHLAGMLVGLAEGMTVAQAHKLAAVVAGLSVTSPHTINKDITRERVWSIYAQLA